METQRKTLSGTKKFLNNAEGRQAKRKQMANQWIAQRGVCGECGDRINHLDDAVFVKQDFSEGEEVKVIHKTCR